LPNQERCPLWICNQTAIFGFSENNSSNTRRAVRGGISDIVSSLVKTQCFRFFSLIRIALFKRMDNPYPVLNSIFYTKWCVRKSIFPCRVHRIRNFACMASRKVRCSCFEQILQKIIVEFPVVWDLKLRLQENYSKIRLPVKVRWPSNASWCSSFGIPMRLSPESKFCKRTLEQVRESPPLNRSRTSFPVTQMGLFQTLTPTSISWFSITNGHFLMAINWGCIWPVETIHNIPID